MKWKMISGLKIKDLFKKAGASRISKKAIKELNKIVENYIFTIARKAVKNAEYSGRKTIKAIDIKEALEEIKKTEKLEDYIK